MTVYVKRKDKATGKITICCDYSNLEIAEKAKAAYERRDKEGEFFLSSEF